MNGFTINQNQSSQPLPFLLIASADHLTGLTGATPFVAISKNGGAFAAPAGAVSEIGYGWYAIAGNATDSNTLGGLALHATATNADPSDSLFYVQPTPFAASAYTPPPTPSTIATAIWTDVTSTDFTVTGSPGYLVVQNINTPISTRLAAVSYVNPPSVSQIATAVLTDTAVSDLSVSGSLGYQVAHAPPWYVAPPTVTQISTGVLTDTTPTDLSTAGSLGYTIAHAPSWYVLAPTTAQVATAVWTDITAGDFTVAGSPGAKITALPIATQIATAILTDTTSGDISTAGSLGYMIGHSPSWYAAPPTTAQIATAVLTDTASSDLAASGSLGYIVGHAPVWYDAPPTVAQISTGILTDATAADLAVSGSLGYIVNHNPAWYDGTAIVAGYTGSATTPFNPNQLITIPSPITPGASAVTFAQAIWSAMLTTVGSQAISNQTLYMYNPDGATAFATFQLNDPQTPSIRTYVTNAPPPPVLP